MIRSFSFTKNSPYKNDNDRSPKSKSKEYNKNISKCDIDTPLISNQLIIKQLINK